MISKKSIERLCLPDQVYEILREQIFDRIFAPDEKLNIEALARKMKVSATPIREALSRLSAEGLVKIEPYIGAKVAPIPSWDHYRQIYDLRLVLEPWAAAEAAKHKDPTALKEMAEALQAMEATELAKRYRRFKTFSDADEAFHRAIFKGACNEPALQSFVQLNTHLHVARLYIDTTHYTDEAREFHLAIFNAIQSGQHKLAHQQMRNHLDRSKYRLLDASQEVTAAKSKPSPNKGVTLMSRIKSIEIVDFQFDSPNKERIGVGQLITYKKGASIRATKNAIAITTEDGHRGEYVTNWVASPATRGEMDMLAPFMIGRNALAREEIYDDLKREIRQWSGMGHGPLDIALWDLAGKKYNASISELLGGYRNRLPVYASTYLGDDKTGLNCKEAYAEFAEQCYELGFRAYKIHGWNEGDARKEAENVLHVAAMVGDRMTLMLDPANQLRKFSDALYVGRACDEANYFWYEDPMRDNGKSAFMHQKLRSMIKTPLLITEYVRGIEPKADFVIAGGTDFLRVDPEYDHGITGSLRIAHVGEALGLDVEVHACGPAHRHLMSAMRNSNFYELALVGPDCPNMVAPVYTCGYTDQLDCCGTDGCVQVPSGPGLGVTYDWNFIRKNAIATRIYD